MSSDSNAEPFAHRSAAPKMEKPVSYIDWTDCLTLTLASFFMTVWCLASIQHVSLLAKLQAGQVLSQVRCSNGNLRTSGAIQFSGFYL